MQPARPQTPRGPARRYPAKLIAIMVTVVVVVVAVAILALPTVTSRKTVTAGAWSVLLTKADMPQDPSLVLVSNGSYPVWMGPGTSAAWLNLQGMYGVHYQLQVKLMLWVAADASAAAAQYSSLVTATPYKTSDLGIQGADAASYFNAYNFTSGAVSSNGLQVLRHNVVFFFYFDSDQTSQYLTTLQAWASAQLQRVETFAH